MRHARHVILLMGDLLFVCIYLHDQPSLLPISMHPVWEDERMTFSGAMEEFGIHIFQCGMRETLILCSFFRILSTNRTHDQHLPGIIHDGDLS